MPSAERVFKAKEEYKAYTEKYALGLARVACALIVILVPLFSIPDYFAYPIYFKKLLIIRFACTLAVLILLLFTFTHRGKRYGSLIEMIAFIIVGFSISLMIRFIGGYQSPYYAGLNLVIIGIAIFAPWGVRESIISCSLIYASYIIPIILYDTIEDTAILINNNIFLLSTITIAIVCSYFTSRARHREFIARLELEQARDELKRLDTLKNEFFARVSHELRTPLTNIILPIQNMLTEQGDRLDPEDREEKETVLRNAQKLLRRINEILDISKLEAGKMKVTASLKDLNSILEDIVVASSIAAKQIGIDLVFEQDNQLSMIYVDTEKIEKVFSNIVSNALKFTDHGGKVEVKTKEAEDHIVVRVSDTGVGIPQEHLPYIFDRFHQVDGSSSRRYEGTGLGLCIVKEFLELHHGSVEVTSELGKGTAFTVHLLKDKDHFARGQIKEEPQFQTSDGLVERRRGERRKGERREMPEEDRETVNLLQVQLSDLVQGAGYSEAGGAGEAERGEKDNSVLVVEDNRDLASNIARSLAGFYNVLVAYNGQHALDRVQQKMPDLIISDVMMPEMDGYELCDKIKSDERTQHIPIVLLTAKATVGDKIEGLKHGADQYLAKPFNPNELHAVVDSLLTKRELQAQLNKRNLELKKALHELEEAQVQLVHAARLESAGLLAAGVAHEIKNNMYCLRAGLEGINKRLTMLSKGKLDIKDTYRGLAKALETNNKAIEHSLFIVNSLLEFSRKDKEGMAFSDTNKGIEDTLTMVLPMIKDKITIHKEYGEIDKVECRIEEINQVIMNMIVNAYQAMEEKGIVRIKTAQNEDTVIITIADDGPGIPQEHLPKIFTPFFSTKEGQNSGLGLSICYNIIKDHHGTVDIKSTPGQGTEFTIALPTRQPK
ncbi:MAG: response regulator [Desulfobacterales bacterium]|nr:response regulator [Desulfobacterales bacterium]